MTDNRMLQMILDTVTGIRSDLKRVEDKLTKRIDKLGAQLSYLEMMHPLSKNLTNSKRE